LTLPFRVRTGRLFVLHVGDLFDLIFRNRLGIPSGTSTDELDRSMWEGKQLRPQEQFYTEVLILDKKLPIPLGFRDAFIRYFTQPNAGDMPGVEARYFKAFSRLNDAIVGYHHASNSLFGGAPVERLGDHVFFERLRYLHTIVSPAGHVLSERELLEIFDARAEREFRQVSGMFTTHQLDDLPEIQLGKIQRYESLQSFCKDRRARRGGRRRITRRWSGPRRRYLPRTHMLWFMSASSAPMWVLKAEDMELPRRSFPRPLTQHGRRATKRL
jgi:hypothetical protein